MLRLRRCILSHLLPPSLPYTPPSVSPRFPLHRLLSATASSFAAEEYLVANCGLTPAQALKASKKLSHLNSPSKQDAVLAFFAGLGQSRADVATVVSKDPQFLCSNVEKTLAPRVVELSSLGLSCPEMARLLLTVQIPFRTASLHRNIEFWLSVFGSVDELLKVLKWNNGLIGMDLENVAKPNLELLQQSGISISDVPTKFLFRMITRSTKHLQETLACVDEFGIERDSPVFPRALATFAILSQQKLNQKIQLFEKLGWSRDDIAQGVRRSPHILAQSEERVRRNLEFLIRDVGLEIPYIAQRPALMLYSFERRLFPRHCLINFLKAKELLCSASFISIAVMGNEKFLHRFVHRYEESIPGLAAAFASSCSGKQLWEHLCKKTGKEKLLTL